MIRKILSYILNFIGSVMFYNRDIRMVGVTGTNGKTTTTFLIKNYLEKLNNKCGLIGTEIIYDGKTTEDSVLTTPGTIKLIKILLRMLYNKCTDCCMEVSSHGIDMNRIGFIKYNAAILTNISYDHLEYHLTLSNYIDCKVSFLQKQKVVIINIDDANYEYILSKLSKSQIIYTYGMNEMADFKFCNVNMNNTHTNFELVYKNTSYMVTTVLIGLHNVYNFVSCLAYLIHRGYNINDLIKISDKIHPPDGRLEEVFPNIFVDYAHTPSAIKSVISYFRQTSTKKIIVVFGTGGKSGNIRMIKEKRQMMAAEAQAADFVIITSDNSRNEDINVICRQLYDNINHMNKKIIIDRAKAIEYAITDYSDYIILVLGKGNEKFIKQDGKQFRFNDKNIIKQIFKKYFELHYKT